MITFPGGCIWRKCTLGGNFQQESRNPLLMGGFLFLFTNFVQGAAQFAKACSLRHRQHAPNQDNEMAYIDIH